MTINTRLEFDGAGPNNQRLQQVIDQLAAQISTAAGTPGGTNLQLQYNAGGVFAGANWKWQTSGVVGEPSFMQGGPDTYGPSGWSGQNISLEILRNVGTQSDINEVDVETYAGDIASSFVQAITVTAGTQTGGTKDLYVLDGVYVTAQTTLGVGRLVNYVIGVTGNSFNFGAGTASNARAVQGQVGSTVAVPGQMTQASSFHGLAFNIGQSGVGISYILYGDHYGRVTPSAEHYGVWLGDMNNPPGQIATNAYYYWFNSQGVRRCKEDASFDSVGQAIEALYNPQFAKYTPGAANFERGILGQWTGNVFQITTEKGGTGTLRGMQLGATTATPLGFYGKTPIACAVLATGAAHTVDDVITALQNLGLVKQS